MNRVTTCVRLSLIVAVAIASLGVGLIGFTPTKAHAQPADYPASCTPGPNMSEAACHADLNAQETAKCVAAGGRMTTQGSFNRACVFPPRGGGYAAPNVNPAGSRQQQITQGGLNAIGIGLAYLANEQAEREAEAQQAQAQADAEAAEREAQAEALRQQQAAADARRRAGLANPFGGGQQPTSSDNPFAAGGGRQPTSSDNPFAAPSDGGAGANGGAPVQVATADLNANPFAAPATPQAAKPPPDRKLGDPNQADSLGPITYSACKAMAPRADIIELPNGVGYCVVEVDTPERTNEWHHLTDDPLRPSPHAPSPASGVRG